jgi:hypothetical protein
MKIVATKFYRSVVGVAVLSIPEASRSYIELKNSWGAKKKNSNVIAIDLNASAKVGVNHVA